MLMFPLVISSIDILIRCIVRLNTSRLRLQAKMKSRIDDFENQLKCANGLLVDAEIQQSATGVILEAKMLRPDTFR